MTKQDQIFKAAIAIFTSNDLDLRNLSLSDDRRRMEVEKMVSEQSRRAWVAAELFVAARPRDGAGG